VPPVTTSVTLQLARSVRPRVVTMPAERARGELAATGVHARSAGVGGVADLTPRELQIALAVAEGRRNKEIAGALFMSVRTVEFHLTRVFIKLGVRSRGELSARLASRELGQP